MSCRRRADKTLHISPCCPYVDSEEESDSNERSDKTHQGRMRLEESYDVRNSKRQPYHPDQPQEKWREAAALQGCACLIWIFRLHVFQLLVTFSAFHSGYMNYRRSVLYVTDPGFSAPFYRETGRLSSIVLHNARPRSIPQYLFTRRIPVLLLRIWLNVF